MDLEKQRPKREDKKSFLLPSREPIKGLQEVQSGLVRRVAKLFQKQGREHRIATVDQDATIIESHKQAAKYPCHEKGLLAWLKDPEREKEPGGRIGFAVSALMSEALAQALRTVGESDWKTFGKEDDGTLRQWAEVGFVPGDKDEQKDSKPLRYVGLRLLKPQGVLFKDGSDRDFHAVVTMMTESRA